MVSGSWNDEIRTIYDCLSALRCSDDKGRMMGASEGLEILRALTEEARDKDKVCYLIGNGASASIASHMAADLAKNALLHAQVFSDLSLITAMANDIGYEHVYSEPLRSRAASGDMLIAISSSGESANIINAAKTAKSLQMKVITLSAMKAGNTLRQCGDINLYIPAADYGHAESGHTAVLHYWMDMMATGEAVEKAAPHRSIMPFAQEKNGPVEKPDSGKGFETFDRSRLNLKPLAERESDFHTTDIRNLEQTENLSPDLTKVAERIMEAKEKGSSVIVIMGAHVIRSGVQRFLIDMMEQGYISALATNGAGAIHDFELAMTGSTTESVARYISEGQFGLWEETSGLNDIVTKGWRAGLGLGESAGKAIVESGFAHKDISVFAAGYRLGIPVTCHTGIGYDICHEHPNCDGAAYGATSYLDFLRFCHVVESLEGGVVMNFGSSVTGPEVFLKALAMARNAAKSDGRKISDFTTLVCDLHQLNGNYRQEPSKDDPAYYFRPFKTMLVRTVADGGRSYYVRGYHSETVPSLWSELGRLSGAKNHTDRTT